MNCSILGLGTAVPPDIVPQDEALRLSLDVICESEREERLMRMLFNRSGVETRHAVVPSSLGYEWKQMHDPLAPGNGPRTAERMQLYNKFAGPLAEQAARNALHDAQTNADQITHLVTVSCTGFGAPGVDVSLIKSLGLKPTTQRVHVGFMGCHGAINGMRVVQGLVAANPGARVLLCAVELSSLHYRLKWDDDGIIGHALFGDGAAAMVAGAETDADSSGLWQLAGTGSCLIPDSEDEMAWHVGDHGFYMRLTSQVPETIKRCLRTWLESWLESMGSAQERVDAWAIHPGGPKILDAVEAALNLPDGATDISRDILRKNGNMSSPTVLFVLDRMRRKAISGPVVALAFGPGLMAEAAFLVPPSVA